MIKSHFYHISLSWLQMTVHVIWLIACSDHVITRFWKEKNTWNKKSDVFGSALLILIICLKLSILSPTVF